ncbi:MAG TPA: hypothetical protein VJZ25_07130 [Gemmatimonadaceae bacterium]|nr:hypothetical protein [Gemmatimonadaceae bacterium]
MTDSTRTILLRLPANENGEPVPTEAMCHASHEAMIDGARYLDAAFRAAPRVTEDEIVRARVMALPGYEDDDVDDEIVTMRNLSVLKIGDFFVLRDDLLRALGVPDVAEKEEPGNE